jgi:hypothetical protein
VGSEAGTGLRMSRPGTTRTPMSTRNTRSSPVVTCDNAAQTWSGAAAIVVEWRSTAWKLGTSRSRTAETTCSESAIALPWPDAIPFPDAAYPPAPRSRRQQRACAGADVERNRGPGGRCPSQANSAA